MRYSNFQETQFRQSVDDAIKSIERILHTDRKPMLAEHVDHTYQNKYELANMITNSAIIAQLNVLERMGLDAKILKEVAQEAKASKRSVTLRFEVIHNSEFLEEKQIEVPSDSFTEVQETTPGMIGSTQKSTVTRIVRKVNEFHWKVTNSWKLSVYVGAYDASSARILQERTSSEVIVTQSGADNPPNSSLKSNDPAEVSLTWILDQIDTESMSASFSIDVADEVNTRTPRRNQQVDEAISWWNNLADWSHDCALFFSADVQEKILKRNNLAVPSANTAVKADLDKEKTPNVFCPIRPIMEDSAAIESANSMPDADGGEENQSSTVKYRNVNNNAGTGLTSPLLSTRDISKLLNEHCRSLDEKIGKIAQEYPSEDHDALLSTVEATFYILCRHSVALSDQYGSVIRYIEEMLKKQLKAAIGKEVKPKDVDAFMKYHNAKLLKIPPKPFCHAIRRPHHYPDGVLSIETSDDGHGGRVAGDESHAPINTMARKVESDEPLMMPLNAAVTIDLTGDRYLHGWMQHRFQNSHKTYRLAARARQFSSFVLVVGQMTGPNSISPKDAIILQNKDEIIIPLLLEELPSAKEFKDAIQSLSPEQQRFAKAFRRMQLESSVLGVCIIQIKPQLEVLLGLPDNALTKEMKLTQDLTELFVEYQVPSDLLSYDGSTGSDEIGADGELDGAIGSKGKVAHVKGHVQAVLDVVESAKKKQLEEQKMAAEMSKAFSQASSYCPSPAYTPSSPEYSSLSPVYSPACPASRPTNPTYGPTTPAYCPTTPAYGPTTPAYGPTNPTYGPTTPAYCPTTPAFIPESSAYIPEFTPMSSSIPCNRDQSVEIAKSERRKRIPKSFFDLAGQRPRAFHPDNTVMQTSKSITGTAEGKSDNPKNSKRKLQEIDTDRHGAKQRDQTNQKTENSHRTPLSYPTVADFTIIPKLLDSAMEQHDKDNAMRTTIVKTTDKWERSRQDNLLTKAKKSRLEKDHIRRETNKAFDLLDALSRSGSLPIACSELHVIVSVTHGFENDVMGTVIQDNINPIEKLEKSTLLLASTIYGVSPRELVKKESDASRLNTAFPAMFDDVDANDHNEDEPNHEMNESVKNPSPP